MTTNKKLTMEQETIIHARMIHMHEIEPLTGKEAEAWIVETIKKCNTIK